MADLGKLDISDWLSLAVVSVGAGMGSAMAWFSKSNKRRDDLIEDLDDKVEKYKDLVIGQATDIRVMKTCQDNLLDKMNELKDNIERTAMQGAHSVNTQIATLTNEIQKLISHNNRRGHE